MYIVIPILFALWALLRITENSSIGMGLLLSKSTRKPPGLTSSSEKRIAKKGTYFYIKNALRWDLELNPGIFWSRVRLIDLVVSICNHLPRGHKSDSQHFQNFKSGLGLNWIFIFDIAGIFKRTFSMQAVSMC